MKHMNSPSFPIVACKERGLQQRLLSPKFGLLGFSQKWQFYIETQPVRFIDRELFPQLVSVTRRLASFVGEEQTYGQLAYLSEPAHSSF